MGKILLILFYCVTLFCYRKAYTQQNTAYIFRHLNQSDGLLHPEIKSIVQDGKGYIWIFTPGGLQRYDGVRFLNYPYDLNNPNWLSDIRDADLFADKKKNCLWITHLEIQRLDLQKNTFTLYNEEKILQDSSFKFTPYVDADGKEWRLGDFGIFYHSNDRGKLIRLALGSPLLAYNKSHAFFSDTTNGDTWMANWPGLSLFHKATGKVYTHEYNPIHNELLQLMDKTKLTQVMQDSEHNIWIGSSLDSFFKYNTITKKLSAYSLTGNKNFKITVSDPHAAVMVNCFFEDNRHTIWIATSNAGLLKYNREKDNFTAIVNDEKNRQGLHYNYSITCIFQDEEENIWLGTDKGINIFNPYRQYFQSIHHYENNASSISKNEILNFIQAANGDIIAGTWGGGVTVYDSNFNFKKNIYLKGPYQYNMIWSFAENEDGNIWMGCQHGFIHIYNPLTGAISTIRPPELNNSTVWCMAKDNKGNIWMGLHNGKIAGWNKQENKFYAYNGSVKGIEQTYGPAINIFFDSKQRCWVSTQTGFKQFDTEKRIYLAVYLPDKNNSHAISANLCNGIEEYDDGSLLIGTSYGGLNIFNPEMKTFAQLTTKNGLPSNTIHAIKKDAAGYIWFTTDYELYKFKIPENKFTRLNVEAGTVNSEFNNAAFYALKNGRWLTSSTTEIIFFSPANITAEKKAAAKVEITAFKIFDSTLSIDSLIDVNKPVQLSYQQNFLTVEFAVLNFSNLQQINYYYRLDAIDKNWVNAGSKNIASYTNLDPGEYTFSVKADDGNKMSPVSSFKIIITPPFWKKTLFRASYLLAAGLFIFWLYKRRIKTVRHEAEMKQKIAETEMMALRAQMNPHFIFNCLNSIDNLIQVDEKEKATLYLAKFARLIRSILENSKNNVVPCWKDMETLKLYIELEELRCDKKFTYEINIADDILNGDYKVPPLVIQPFVENAIHHGLLNKIESDRKLKIDVTVTGNYIHYAIEDNGVGRAKAESYKQLNKPAHESMGMQITTDRINLFNQSRNGAVKITDIVNEYHQPAGTKVEVELINQS